METTMQPAALQHTMGCPSHMVVDVYLYLIMQGYVTDNRWRTLTDKGLALGLGVNRKKAYPLFYPAVVPLVPRTVLLAGLDVYLSQTSSDSTT
jgi:hypothetical protein